MYACMYTQYSQWPHRKWPEHDSNIEEQLWRHCHGVQVYMHIHERMYVCVDVCMYVIVYTHKHTHTWTCMYVSIRACMYAHYSQWPHRKWPEHDSNIKKQLWRHCHGVQVYRGYALVIDLDTHKAAAELRLGWACLCMYVCMYVCVSEFYVCGYMCRYSLSSTLTLTRLLLKCHLDKLDCAYMYIWM